MAADEASLVGGYQPVTLSTGRGDVRCRLYAADATDRGVIWIGGVGGGWDTPARNMYPRLGAELTGEDVTSLRVRYRDSRDLNEAVFDVLAGFKYLETLGIRRLGVVGHSFGGAVAIRAAAAVTEVKAVVTLASQGFGAGPAAALGPRVALLSIHGKDDEVLAPESSEYIQKIAREPKRVVIFSGARHALDEVADRVHRETRDWLLRWV